MHPRLSEFQDALAAALRPGAAPIRAAPWLAALACQPGFAVYRNTVAQGCLDALRANYPTVRQLLGDACFDGAALDYARVAPPADPRLMLYGAGFAEHLANWPPCATLPYLRDVARLDRLWSESHAAADAPAAAPAWLATQTPTALGAMRLRPHPATRWLWCAEHPVFTLWRRHREALLLDGPLPWHGEGALLTRPEAAVRWHALDVAGHTFLAQCARGHTLQDAGTATLGTHPEADLGAVLAQLLCAGALSPCNAPD